LEKHTKKLNSTDYLVSLDWVNNFGELEEVTKKSFWGTIEIVCHPEIKMENEKIKTTM